MTIAPHSRVIFVNRVYWPSTEATAQLLTDLAENLAARGWEVHVLAAGETSTSRHGVTIHRTGTGDSHHGMISRALNYRRFLHAARQQLLALAGPGDVVVAMTDPPLLGVTVADAARRTGARVVHWIQDIYPEIAAAHFGWPAEMLLRRSRVARDAAWRAGAACVTLGADMAARVAAAGVSARRLHVIPNWAPRELDAAPDPAAVAAKRAAWGVADKFVVAYSGNFGRVHEFDTLLDAAERLASEPPFAFLLIGRGARFPAVAAQVRRRRLAHVQLLPSEPRAQLAAALAAADAHFVTLESRYRGLVHPSKLAGVLAAGRPPLLIAPPGSDLVRLVEEAGCGAAFAPGEGARLADTLRRWRADPAERARLGARARLAYERNFAAATAFARWAQVMSSA